MIGMMDGGGRGMQIREDEENTAAFLLVLI